MVDPRRGGSERPADPGAAPPSMVAPHGPGDDRHWWRRLERVRLYEEPRSAADLGVEEDTLPPVGHAHVIRVAGGRNGTADGRLEGDTHSPLDRLTAAMDAAWDDGRVTDEAIDAAIRNFRAGRPDGR